MEFRGRTQRRWCYCAVHILQKPRAPMVCSPLPGIRVRYHPEWKGISRTLPENNCNDVSGKTPCSLMAKGIYCIQICHPNILLKYCFPHPSFMSLLLYNIQFCYLHLWAGFLPSQLMMHVSSSKTKGPTTIVLQVTTGKFSYATLIKQFGPRKCYNWTSCKDHQLK